MTPMGMPSRSRGTPIMQRTFPTRASFFLAYRGSVHASVICIVRLSDAAQPTIVPGPGRMIRRRSILS
jgi:hypothetical protein